MPHKRGFQEIIAIIIFFPLSPTYRCKRAIIMVIITFLRITNKVMKGRGNDAKNSLISKNHAYSYQKEMQRYQLRQNIKCSTGQLS